MPHTPGPWEFHRITFGHPTNELNPIVSAPGHHIARLFFQGSTVLGMTSLGAETLEEAEANARLIAAAPDLLAACKTARDRFYRLGSDFGDNAGDELEALIAKAQEKK